MQNARARVLLVEDRPTLRRSLARILSTQYEVLEASTLAEGTRLLASCPDVAIVDLKLPDGEGTDLLAPAQHLPNPPSVIVLTAYGSVETAVAAMKAGAYDFLTKPLDAQHLLMVVSRALDERRLRRRWEVMARQIDEHPAMVGRDPAFLEVLAKADAVAPTDTTVLILGESGTGKELLARRIHSHSGRREGMFVPVNCASISPTLAESALFGHEKGAFTGATERHRGWFELAHGGTLFLDEVGDLETSLQGKFLRVLEEGTFQRLGGSQFVRVSVRVIAASNKDLWQEVARGRFRADLYYRLAIFPLTLPPLRERKGDIPMLASYLLSRHCAALGRPPLTLSEDALEALVAYQWPGNVRELSNVLERAVLLARGPVITASSLPPLLPHAPGWTASGPLARRVAEAVERVEREAIAQALRQTGGRRREAARMLGISYRTLLNKLAHYGMETPTTPPQAGGA